VVKIVVGARHAGHKILKWMLAEPPLVLEKKLVGSSGGTATRLRVIDGGLN
jgi:hypothetical protein